MADTENFALDFDPGTKSKDQASARIFVETAVSYLKDGGALVLTRDCTSEAMLREEIERLRGELSVLEEEGKNLFAGKLESRSAEAAQPVGTDNASVDSQPKTPLVIDQDLTVADRMTRQVITVDRNQMLAEADAKLRAGGFRHLVVVEEG